MPRRFGFDPQQAYVEFVADKVAMGPTFLRILGTQHSFTHIPSLHTLPYIATASDNTVRHTCITQQYGNLECPRMSAIQNCNNVHKISSYTATGWHTTGADGSCFSNKLWDKRMCFCEGSWRRAGFVTRSFASRAA